MLQVLAQWLPLTLKLRHCHRHRFPPYRCCCRCFCRRCSLLLQATVRLHGPDGAMHVEAAVGDGPIDAAFQAIKKIAQVQCTLLEFNVHSVTRGIDALGRSPCASRAEGRKCCEACGSTFSEGPCYNHNMSEVAFVSVTWPFF